MSNDRLDRSDVTDRVFEAQSLVQTINTVLDPLEDRHAELIPLRRVCDVLERLLGEVAHSLEEPLP